jgi:hypothetical protein
LFWAGAVVGPLRQAKRSVLEAAVFFFFARALTLSLKLLWFFVHMRCCDEDFLSDIFQVVFAGPERLILPVML